MDGREEGVAASALFIESNLNPNLFLHEGNKSVHLIWLWLHTMNCVKMKSYWEREEGIEQGPEGVCVREREKRESESERDNK